MSKSSASIRFIALVNGVAAVITIAFWILAFTQLPAPGSLDQPAERMNMATTYGFGIADVIWALPLLSLAAAGLWNLHAWGWLAAQMANVLWWYSLTVITLRDLFSRTLSPGTVLFIPFALFAFWAAFHLWKMRRHFWKNEVSA